MKSVTITKEMSWGSVRTAKIELAECYDGTFLTVCISKWDDGTLGFCSSRLAKTLEKANEDYQFFIDLMAGVYKEK